MTVLFAGQQIPKSPFEVNVDKALGDASKVTVKGAGLEPVGNIANKATYFNIYTAGQRSQTQKWPMRVFSDQTDPIKASDALNNNKKNILQILTGWMSLQ